jgi:hypothetical protein
MFHFTKKRAIVIAVIGSLALGAGAYAYFTSTGAGTGTAAVGSAAPFTVAVSAATGGPLYPAAGSQSLGYVVTNSSDGTQRLRTVTAAPESSELPGSLGDIVTSTGVVSGCKAEWFTVVATTPGLAMDLASHATASGTAVVTMANVNASQDACQGSSPNITVTAG